MPSPTHPWSSITSSSAPARPGCALANGLSADPNTMGGRGWEDVLPRLDHSGAKSALRTLHFRHKRSTFL
jgi:hypothetical protein